ncbi:CotH kinase family protein [Myroides odoratus]|uniref:Por secretion system C-terminal sorting domain n=1 Tax=Myroides odoratus TaxID=256 RepID=A0A378RQV4_MYROD|nr:CotH kinase family protein [Myroides odoratus]QQU04509.1 CotH kinase family protein [Myroides odoratus]STZ28060.1 Por secretion system C-terminal sorting domain [Myroides odoratus]
MMKKCYLVLVFSLTLSVFGQQVKPPVFSAASGFYEQAFTLHLSHENSNVQIVYTLDGSEPTLENLGGSTFTYKTKYPERGGQLPFELHQDTIRSLMYTTPIAIYDRTMEPNRLANISTTFESNPYFPATPIDKSFVVRAKAYLDNQHFSETTTRVYLINKEYAFPVVNINVNDDQLFGYENGLWVAGKTFDDWRLANPQVDQYETTVPANYWVSGSASEVPVNFIYLAHGGEKINQTVGIRNHGNGSRHFKNRSYRMYAKSEYGKKDLKYNFFDEYPYDSFKRLIVRNSGNDTYRTMFRDAFVQKLNEHLHFETQKYQPVVTFVNGEYYGLMNLRERYDEKYFERVYDIKERDLDFLENAGLADVGDNVQYLKVIDFFTNQNLKKKKNYKKALTYIDEVNFTDFQIAEIYAANFDWPHNNNTYFRKRVEYTPDAPYGQDGRFRWVFKDLDAGFNGIDEWINNSYSHNTLASAIASEDHILKGLLANETYKNYFLNRFADLMNTSYKEEHVIALINEMQERIRPEMPRYIERWNLLTSMQDWENRVEQMREFARLRPTYQDQHIQTHFNLSGKYRLKAHINDKDRGFVKVNTIEINSSTVGVGDEYENWQGYYFKTIPVTVEAIALPGYRFVRWEGDVQSTQSKIIINPRANFKVKAIFKRAQGERAVEQLDFVLYPNPTTDILHVTSESESAVSYRIFDAIGQVIQQNTVTDQGINVSQLNKGVYLIELNQDNKRVVKRFVKK